MSVWTGAEVSMFNPDWGCESNSPFSCGSNQLVGVAAFTDVNRLIGRVGLEGEARWLYWAGPPYEVHEASYLAGPRVQIISWRRWSGNVKFLFGGATFSTKYTHGWEGWTAYAPGATVGYRLTPRLMLRGDYEYQRWPGYVGNLGQHGLTPNGFSVGVSYRILH